MRNRKNKILIGVLKVCVALSFLSCCALDSESIIPLIVCSISLTYITLFTIANTRG
jgi:hypothetical protein